MNAVASMQSVLKRLSRFAHDRRGGIIMPFALSVSVLAVLVCCGVELASLASDRAKLQDAADSAALFGAAELSMSTAVGVKNRAQEYAIEQSGPAGTRLSAVATADIIDMPDHSQALKVAISGHRASFFGSMLPPGGFNVAVSSTALGVGKRALCVLVHGDPANGDSMKVANKAQVTAPDCLVQSNDDIKVDSGALISAGVVQAVTRAVGPITPAAQVGAAKIADPFANLKLKQPSCGLDFVVGTLLPVEYKDGGTQTLSAGSHCGGIVVKNGTILKLAPGEHYFAGDVQVNDTAQLLGDDVVLGFDATSKFSFGGNSVVKLSGRKSGDYAGFVIFTTRNNVKDFVIQSDHVSELLGTIYIPSARFVVQGAGKVAQESAWTVIVSKTMQISGNPIVYINANYASTSVPVPGGVGNRANLTRLIN